MEQKISIDQPSLSKYLIEDVNDPFEYFDKAKSFTFDHYKDEFDRIAAVKFEDVSPEFFFREVQWVIGATGFSAAAVSKFFPRLIEAYGDWKVLSSEEFEDVMKRVKGVCNNPQKAKAVWTISRQMNLDIQQIGWDKYRDSLLNTPDKLENLPYIGKITKYHLARNIGLLDFIKPDLHLVRLAKHFGFKDSVDMCQQMSDGSMKLGLVDLCLWYFASHAGTLHLKKDGTR